jgi:hypothetical protein
LNPYVSAIGTNWTRLFAVWKSAIGFGFRRSINWSVEYGQK